MKLRRYLSLGVAPNVFGIGTITVTSNSLIVTASPLAIVTNAALSGTVVVVKSLFIANVSATLSGLITVDRFLGGVATRLVTALSVPIQGTIVPITVESPVNLVEGETLRLTANAILLFEGSANYDIYGP